MSSSLITKQIDVKLFVNSNDNYQLKIKSLISNEHIDRS